MLRAIRLLLLRLQVTEVTWNLSYSQNSDYSVHVT